jgi:hypothetical protein
MAEHKETSSTPSTPSLSYKGSDVPDVKVIKKEEIAEPAKAPAAEGTQKRDDKINHHVYVC